VLARALESPSETLVNTIRILGAVALAVGLSSSISSAQSVPVDRFILGARPDDAFHAARLGRVGHGRFGVSLAGDYAFRPLVVQNTAGNDVELIERHLTVHANLSVSLFDRLVLFAGIYGSALMEGDAVPARYARIIDEADGAGLGDTRLGARLRIYGAEDGPVGVGIQASVTMPTADTADDAQRYQGEHMAAVTPEAILEFRAKSIVTVTVNAGAHIRENARFIDIKLGDELRYGLAVGVRPIAPLEFIAEGYGAFSLEDFGERGNTAIEWLVGAKYHHKAGFYAGIAGGTGIRAGYGTPRGRGVLTVGWLTDGRVAPEEELPPDVPPPPPDTDGDGILDPSDSCPKDAEDVDGFEDDDGCPDLDDDKDGVPDASDKCREEAEDLDQFEDTDGCPELDNDNDGKNDADDKCPNEAEDPDDFEDADGCPDLDNDNDGTPDTTDACPMEPGTPEEKGCPKSIRVEGGVIRLLQQINFANNSDVILGESNSIMEELRAAMQANARIAHVRVEGHTDDRGSDKKNLALSKKRAASVTRWLTERGVSSTRLEPWGCGEVQPIDSNKTADGRAKNRRVVFQITEPAPPNGPVEPAAGCQPATTP
jgi:outer membrane protein OmpA-like peptidoglycan-associated protein